MKKLLRFALPPFIFYLIGKLKPKGGKFDSIHNLDQELLNYLNYQDGFFVELGANDGITQSNSLYFEKKKNWRGVLIEPVPNNFIKCVKNRSGSNKIYCCACTSFDYKEKFVEMTYSNLMSIASNLESDIPDIKEHASSGRIYLAKGEETFTFGALAKTLNAVLIDAGAPQLMDLLSLDVEGAEIGVLKGLDHQHFRFKYILTECRDSQKMIRFLDEHNYELLHQLSAFDYLFKSKA